MYSETKKNEMSMKSTSQSENALSDKTKYISYVIFAFFFFFAVNFLILINILTFRLPSWFYSIFTKKR